MEESMRPAFNHKFYLCISLIVSTFSTGPLIAGEADLSLPQKRTEIVTNDGTPPGIEKFSSTLLNKIKHMRQRRGADYRPRTRHLYKNGQAKFINRLFLQSSPYLLQHAHNPVNWYPWGEEAFAEAARRNIPVLLSVGYSTCHWCHVMEEESFEDIEIARYLNQNFIAIKVDREERPDIDAIYMAALNALGQSGGWPMNVWLTADKKPFFGGTYFPARDGDRGVSMGFLSLLKKISEVYVTQAQQISIVSKNIANSIKQSPQNETGKAIPSTKILKQAAEYYKNQFDAFYGGIADAPKFPSTTPIQFLLRYYRRSGDKDVLKIIETSLNKMAAGGIYDQVGGGFHRYSVDNEWLVPHFEKMLYDNALLSIDYLEAYQLTHNENFKRIVNETLAYIKRDMTSTEGGFYSATDADSMTPQGKSEEGYYFTWSPDEIINTLGKEHANLITKYYAVSEQGNFEGRNILNTPQTRQAFSKANAISLPTLNSIIEKSRSILYQQRNTRPHPLRDEKILVAWNGLMISAYAKAGLILNNPDYTQQALNSAHFIFNNLLKKGRLLRSYKDNQAKHNAYLNDYAFLIAGLLDLYEVTYDIQWMKKAIALDKILNSYYEDKHNGGFYMTSSDHEKLLTRQKPDYDSALPTGNSVQALNLLRLAEFTSNASYQTRAIKTLKAFSTPLNRNPMALSKMLLAVDFYHASAKEIIIVTPHNKKHESHGFMAVFRENFIPNRVLSVAEEGSDLNSQAEIISITEDKTAINDQTTAYVCKQGSCKLPTGNVDIFREQLNSNDD
jgi:uncharacterized protein